jgi:hypothetical protein
VTGLAECAGSLYTSIGTKVFRRNDANLPPGGPRWALVYQAAGVAAYNSGIRGLTCVTHEGRPSLLLSTEGRGDVYRATQLGRARRWFLVRTREPSPFGDGRLYCGGYDCNFYPADGTAWIGASTLASINTGDSPTRE